MRILFVIYDDETKGHYFPSGMAYLTSVIIKEGFDVSIYNQDANHYSEEHLTQYLDNNKFDIVGLGFVGGYHPYRKALKISSAINKSRNRPGYYILGGHGPSPEPEYFLNKMSADIVVIGEGEETIVELLKTISSKKPFNDVKGIAYKDGSSVIINPRRPLIGNIDDIPFPAYDRFPILYYRMLSLPRSSSKDFCMPLLSARGCTFKCNFCYRMDEGCRLRSTESIVEEINLLQKDYQITYIDFFDELLMSSKKRVIDICETLLKARIKLKWSCNGRLNYVSRDIIALMKKAGCVYINYGIEAFDDQVLENMNKALNTRQIVSGIEATLAEGISPGFNMIFGNIGDTREVLDKDVDFLLKYDDFSELRTIRPVIPYPGSPLYYLAIKKGLMKDVADFYENKHLNSEFLAVNFTDITDDEFHDALMNANIRLISNHFDKKKASWIEQTRHLYTTKDINFRGYRAHSVS
jgi:radical SAM superfamily enzyme YgiQ (UPF0313 family)